VKPTADIVEDIFGEALFHQNISKSTNRTCTSK